MISETDFEFLPRRLILSAVLLQHAFNKQNTRITSVERFSQSFDVIVLDLSFTRLKVYDVSAHLWDNFIQLHDSMIDYMTVPTSLVLYLSKTLKVKFPERIKKGDGFVATRVILHYSSQMRCFISVNDTITCANNDCNSNEESLKRFANLHGNVLLLHRELYWKISGNMNTVGYFIGNFLFPKINNCLENIRKVDMSSICESGLMAIAILMQQNVVNASINIKWNVPATKLSIDSKIYNPFLVRSEIVNDIHFKPSTIHLLNRYLISQLYFSRTSSFSVIYLTNRKINGADKSFLQFEMWLEPFPIQIWGIVLILILFMGASFLRYGNSEKRKTIYNFGEIFSSKSFKQLGGVIHFILAFNAVLMGSLWEQGLTSLVTIAPTSKTYGTLNELLNAGYKLIEGKKANIEALIHDAYSADFKYLGLYGRFNDSFTTLNQMSTREAKMINMLAGFLTGKRYSAAFPSSWLTIGFPTYAKRYGEHLPNLQFNEQRQKLRKVMMFWKIGTVNRYWMMKTMQSIYQAGLNRKWDEWAKWKALLLNKLLSYVDRSNCYSAEYITRTHVWSVGLIVVVLYVIGLAIFLYEVKIVVRNKCLTIKTSKNKSDQG
ncbi:unnamed protein product [Orchesella dallaii]|uniref:Uncharacterized protein n=1 Tax=Orchesella dallaii TaxID=48710 RepID=A0ABP1RHH9_9HEXA